MSSAQVQSILARCILDAQFLDLLSNDPEAALKGYPLDDSVRQSFRGFDLRRLKQFSGLITKVQNNGLWQPLPHTRALLRHYGLELEVFVEYTRTHQHNRAEGPIGLSEQTHRFMRFLAGWLGSRQDDDSPGVREVLQHENILWEIQRPPVRNAHQEAAGTLASTEGVFSQWVPAVQGSLKIAGYAYNPLAIIAALQKKGFCKESLSPGELWLGYWEDRVAARLHILELDALAARLFQQVDGCRSIAEIIHAALGSRSAQRPDAFRGFFEAANARGLLRLGKAGPG